MNDNICTSVEQSERLVRMGVEERTADMYYVLRHKQPMRLMVRDGALPHDLLDVLPAWSLSALIEILPYFIENNGQDYVLLMLKDRVVYWRNGCENLFETDRDNLIDAVIDAIEWVIETNKEEK